MMDDEYIRDMFYNWNTESLITMSFYLRSFSSVKCRETHLQLIRRNHLEDGYFIFDNEEIKSRDYIQFDKMNNKIIIHDCKNYTCKVFDIKNYTLLYSIHDTRLCDVRTSPGALLLIYKRASKCIRLSMFDIEDGRILKSYKHMLIHQKRVHFVELFNEKILVKQFMTNMRILDMKTSEVIEVENTALMSDPEFISHEKNYFLAFNAGSLKVHNIGGKIDRPFEDHCLRPQEFIMSNLLQVTSDQNLILSYNQTREEEMIGSINVSNIHTGASVGKVCPYDPAVQIAPRRRGEPNRTIVKSTVEEALTKVFALHYNEDANEIYTGNDKGLVHVWCAQ